MVRRHEENILTWFQMPLNNGTVEGLNNKAKLSATKPTGSVLLTSLSATSTTAWSTYRLLLSSTDLCKEPKCQTDTSLRPTIPATISARLKSRKGFADSPSNIMPRTAVPTAPTPTHIAYAVPTGRDFMAMPSRPRLIIMESTVPTVGQRRVNPSVYLSPIAQPTSNKPATTRINQFINTSHKVWPSPVDLER